MVTRNTNLCVKSEFEENDQPYGELPLVMLAVFSVRRGGVGGGHLKQASLVFPYLAHFGLLPFCISIHLSMVSHLACQSSYEHTPCFYYTRATLGA
jgi:hypothetical protein